MSKVTAALLRRSDCPLFKFHVGADYEEVALALGTGHAFVVDVLLVLPRIAPEAPDVFHAFILDKAEHLSNSWFRVGCQPMEGILSALMVSCYQYTPTAATSPDPAHPQDADASDAPDVVVHQAVQPTIWDFVEACETPHADKASVIRSHLEQTVGKDRAAGVLGETFGTSSRDQFGKKQRIFTIDGKAIRVKKE